MIRNKDKAKVMTEHILCDCKDKYYNNKKDKYYSKKCYDASIKTILKKEEIAIFYLPFYYLLYYY